MHPGTTANFNCPKVNADGVLDASGEADPNCSDEECKSKVGDDPSYCVIPPLNTWCPEDCR